MILHIRGRWMALGLALLLGGAPAALAQSAGSATDRTASGTAAPVDRAETRIKELHDKLQITTAQEPQWDKFATVMRDNATEMRALVDQRQQTAPRANAIDELKSYAALTDAHAQHVKKLVTAFEALYGSLSDEQKKTADTIFASAPRSGGRNEGGIWEMAVAGPVRDASRHRAGFRPRRFGRPAGSPRP